VTEPGLKWPWCVSSGVRGWRDRSLCRRRPPLTVGRKDTLQQTHRLPTARTDRDRRGRWKDRQGRAQLYGAAGMTLDTQPLHLGRGVTEAVVADRAQSARQDVSQIALHELHALEGAEFGAVAGVAVLPAEGDGLLGDPHHAGVADGGARDVGSEVFEGGTTVAGGLDVDTPVPAPDVGVDLPVVGLEEAVEVLSEGGLQQGEVDQEVRLLDAHEAAQGVETGAGDETMDVGMKAQLLIPEEVDEELAGGGESLADGLGLPVLLEFDEEEVVAELGFGEEGGVEVEVLVDEAELAVVGVACAAGVVAEGQGFGEAPHGVVGMAVVGGIDQILGGGADGGGRGSRRTWDRGFLDLGASQGGGVAEVVGMNGVDFGIFHAPPIL
jgi:hypothetical protein